MKFIIIGAGDVGLSLSQRLSSHRHDVVLVERLESAIAKLGSEIDFQVIVGNGSSPDILLAAGIESADYFLAVTDNDEANISACLVARMINPKAKRVVRLRDLSLNVPEIDASELSEYFDLVINPSFAAAKHMVGLFEVPGAREVVDFAGGKLRMIGLGVSPQSTAINKRLSTLRELYPNAPTLIIAIVRGNKLIVPGGNDKIRVGDTIYTITKPDETDALFEVAGRETLAAKNDLGRNIVRQKHRIDAGAPRDFS